MISDIKNFEMLVEKYRLTEPVPEEIQNYGLKSRDENLLIILKKTGEYTLIFAVLLKFYYLMKNSGLKITFIQARIILLSAALTIGLAASIATYKVIAYKTSTVVIDHSADHAEVSEINDTIHETGSLPVKNRDQISSGKNYAVGVAGFTGDTGSLRITNTIYKMMKDKKSSPGIIMLTETKRNRVDKILSGSVRNIGAVKYITAKLINVKDSKVIFLINIEVESEDQIEGACKKIASAIEDKI